MQVSLAQVTQNLAQPLGLLEVITKLLQTRSGQSACQLNITPSWLGDAKSFNSNKIISRG